MEPERWRQVKDLMLAAAALAPDERTAFLDRSCRSDTSLRAEVTALLEADADAGTFLESPPPGKLGESEVPGRIGPYQILRELGEGGMGTVYLAERHGDEYHNRVALKVLKGSFVGADVARRFHTEGHILSRLEHPGIARLLDGGRSSQGIPYLVMEHVQGTPIDRYCRERELTVETRLELFRKVCSAVHFAHRNLVVHRDLKPSNILVTAAGVPKLLDFGIAKLLAPDWAPSTAESTVAGSRWMTPDYASPEQVREGPITTATDVYSLGLVLYELLTGRSAYVLKNGRFEELLRAICEQEPKRPSLATGERAGVPAAGRRLRGDLDHVVLKALRKAPEARYGSVEQLSEDIERHLTGRPVIARRGTIFYRTSRFVRRHPWGILAGAAFLLLILSTVVVTALQRREISRERHRAEQVAEFLIDLFREADPYVSRGRGLDARELLERGVAEIRHQLGEQPELRAALVETMGRVHANLGLDQEAKELLEESLALRREALGDHHLAVAEGLNHLAKVRIQRGELTDAEPLLEEALAIQRRGAGRRHPDVAASLGNLARLRGGQGDFRAAEILARRSLAIYRQASGRRSREVATALHELAGFVAFQDRFEEAEALHRESLALRRELLGGEHGEIMASLNNLAIVLRERGDLAAAMPFAREALGMSRRVFGDRHPQTAAALNNLASLASDLGDLSEAAELYRGALSLNREIWGDEHHLVAINLSNLGIVLQMQGDYAAAEAALREGLELRREALGDEHPLVGQGLNNLGFLMLWKGDHAAAEKLFREALGKARLLGEKNRFVAIVLGHLAEVELARGDLEAADALARQALAMRREVLGEEHPHVALSLSVLAEVLISRGAHREAEPAVRSALAILSSSWAPDHWWTAQARSLLGACMAARGRRMEAERLLTESLGQLRQRTGASSPPARRALRLLEELRAAHLSELDLGRRAGDDLDRQRPSPAVEGGHVELQ